MNLTKIKEILEQEQLLIESNILENKKIEYISYYSKDCESNTLFICKGLKDHFKKEYLEEAYLNGAICYIANTLYKEDTNYFIVKDVYKAMAVVAKEFYHSDTPIALIGVTGTKGKTTTVSFLKNIFSTKERPIPYYSTIDYYTGKRSGESHNTTPESLELYHGIKDAKDTNNPYMIMEVSSQAYKVNRIYKILFDYGIFLNIGKDHISDLEHEDFLDYLNCKIGFLKQCNNVILYDKTDKFEYIKEQLKDKNIITFGFEETSNYQIKNITKEGAYTIFELSHEGIKEEYAISMIGEFNIINAVSAIIVAKLCNIDYLSILRGVSQTKVLGRMNLFKGKCPVIVDYAHNALSLKTLIEALKKEYPNHDLKLVFGCPGDKAINRREELGTLANEHASYVYLTMEDPQTKTVFEISKEIATYLTKVPYTIIEDRALAIKKAILDAKPTDIIAIIGKGEEKYQLIGTTYQPYPSDNEVVKECIANEKREVL